MNKKKVIFPLLLGFFIMGFCDVVGIATSYVKEDFGLSETLAGFIPSMVFIWFLLLSLPSAIFMNKIGRKKTVIISEIITIVAMLIPVMHYSFGLCMLAFALMGIGNTILQVSMTPLLASVVDKEKLTSYLTGGHVTKALSSFCGPFFAAFALMQLGNWKYLFPIYAIITLISLTFIWMTPVKEEEQIEADSKISNTLKLLKDKDILLLFLGIFFAVGVDVGMNTVSPKLMIERAGWTVEKAGLAASVYFICRTIGGFAGTFLLSKINDAKYFLYNIIGAVVIILWLMYAQNPVTILALIGTIGFLCSSIFSIIFSVALKARPEVSNEISGFMITGIFGGAVIPPVMGVMADWTGSQIGSLSVIAVCMLYLVFCAVWMKKFSPQR